MVKGKKPLQEFIRDRKRGLPDMPEEVEKIKRAPDLKLVDFIDLKGDCVDPLALSILVESLDYALMTAARRIKAAGKIFVEVESSAYKPGGLLSIAKALREEIVKVPQCTSKGPKVQPVSQSKEVTIEKIKEGKVDVAKLTPELKALIKEAEKTVAEEKAVFVEEEEEPEWIKVFNEANELIAWEPIDPKTGSGIFEKRVWVGTPEAKKFDLEK